MRGEQLPFIERKYWLQRVRPASFFSRFSLARLQEEMVIDKVPRRNVLCILYTPVLEPHLHYPHVQARVLRQLLAHMSGGFRTVVVGGLQCLQLLGRDCGAGPLVGLITVQGAVQVETCDR